MIDVLEFQRQRWHDKALALLQVYLGVPCIPSGAFKQELHITGDCGYIMGVKVFHWGYPAYAVAGIARSYGSKCIRRGIPMSD